MHNMTCLFLLLVAKGYGYGLFMKCFKFLEIILWVFNDGKGHITVKKIGN